MRPVAVIAVGSVLGDGPGEVESFKPRRELPERKHLKLMSRSVRLGVAAVGRTVTSLPAWNVCSPERRGLFVGSNPTSGAAADLMPALVRVHSPEGVDVAAFGEEGFPYVPPLWLVKGLSNNVLGFASAYWEIRGVNGNRSEGRVGGLAAVVDAARSVSEGRAEIAVGGGADCLLHAKHWVSFPVGEAAVFFALQDAAHAPAGAPRIVGVSLERVREQPADESGGLRGEIGAATGCVALLDALATGGRVRVTDPRGLVVTVDVEPGEIPAR